MQKEEKIDKRILSLEQLKTESKEGLDCYILLNGYLKSSKHIWYDEEAKQFEVINYIDDSEQCLTDKEIMDQKLTNIGEAIKKGALIKD